ncbi:MAG: hypothetical protein KBD78_02715 [Oligoflexales bacterium]|nr:hypothetical protein [Oligoflexales bacterium]
MYLPQAWTKDKNKLAECGVSRDCYVSKTKWEIALELLDS